MAYVFLHCHYIKKVLGHLQNIILPIWARWFKRAILKLAVTSLLKCSITEELYGKIILYAYFFFKANTATQTIKPQGGIHADVLRFKKYVSSVLKLGL